MTVKTKKTVEVDLKLCERQAVCIGIAPTVFQLGKDGRLEILEAEPPEDLWDAIEDAAAACPLNAIVLRSK